MNTFVTLFAAFFKIGLFSFGGGMAMLPIIYQSVQQFGFMSSEEFSNLVALSQVTPGPVAVNAATYVGLMYGGLPAAIVATIGICLPCLPNMDPTSALGGLNPDYPAVYNLLSLTVCKVCV